MTSDAEIVLDLLRRLARRESRHIAVETVGRLLGWGAERAEVALVTVASTPNTGLDRRFVAVCNQGPCSHTWDVTQLVLLATIGRSPFPSTTFCPVCKARRSLDSDTLAREFEYLGPAAPADEQHPGGLASSLVQPPANVTPGPAALRVAEPVAQQPVAAISSATGGSVKDNVINITNNHFYTQGSTGSESSMSGEHKDSSSSLKIDAQGNSEVEGVQVRDGSADIAAKRDSKVKNIAVGAELKEKKDPAWSWRSPASVIGVAGLVVAIVVALISALWGK